MAMTFMNIKQAEVWLLNLNPTIGSEMAKTRPCIVVSDDDIGVLPLKIVVPLGNWQDRFNDYLWMTKIEPDQYNGLSKSSTADSFQLRSVSEQRFVKKLGRVSKEQLVSIHTKIIKTLNIDYY